METTKAKNFFFSSVTPFVIGLLLISYASSVFSQAKDTEYTADKNLKSSARINPSTLAMEFSLPLGLYPGRNGNSIPVTYSYSSKQWQMEMFRTWMWGSSTTIDLNAIFAKNTAAGWTSSLQPPRLKEAVTIYDGAGFKFTPTYATFMQMPQQPLEYNASQGSVVLDYHCFRACVNVEGEPSDCEHFCEPTLIPRSFDEPPGNNSENLRHLIKRFSVIMPDGSSVEFRKDDSIYVLCDSNNPSPPGCLTNLNQNTNGTYLSVDGSGRRLEIGELQADSQYRNVLYLPNGGSYLFSDSNSSAIPFEHPAEKFIDVNGNQISYDYTGVHPEKKVVDTLNREITDYLPLNGISQNQSVGTQTFSLEGLNGQSLSYSLKWEQLKDPNCDSTPTPGCGNSILENEAQELFYRGGNTCVGNHTETYAPALFQKYDYSERVCAKHTSEHAKRFNPIVMSEITLPNGSKYKFKYNVYGEITRIDYPTGGYERFRYDKIPAVGYGAEPVYDQTNRGVVERWLSIDGVTEEQHWEYSVSGSTYTTTAPYIVISTAPDGSYTERYLHYSSSSEFGFSNTLSGMPYEENAFDASGNLRSRTLTDWEVRGPQGAGANQNAKRDPRVKRSVTIMFEVGSSSALATMTVNEFDDAGSTDPEHFSHLNVKRTKGYHYKVLNATNVDDEQLSWATIESWFSNVPIASITETDYSYDPDYKARGITSRPVETRVLNPANPNDVLAKTQFVYDEAAYFDNNYTTTNWVDPNSTLRGNVTTTRTWNKDTDTWLESHTMYDNFGNVRKVWDASGDATKFVETQYDPLYKYAYPTKVITPAPDPSGIHGTNQTSTAETTYDFTTGLPLTVKDDFGQVTTTEYDAVLRPFRVNPIVVNGVATGPITETIYGQPDANGQLPPNQRFVKVRKQIDANNWDEATTWMDGLGRTIKTQATDSQGDVFVETFYDQYGRVERVTNPYRQGDTVLWSKTRYDAAGRAVETFAPATLADVTANNLTSLGTTAFDISTVNDASGNFIGTVVTSTDASGRKGRSITNALGQLLRVDEPTAIGGTETNDLGPLATPNQPTSYFYSPARPDGTRPAGRSEQILPL